MEKYITFYRVTLSFIYDDGRCYDEVKFITINKEKAYEEYTKYICWFEKTYNESIINKKIFNKFLIYQYGIKLEGRYLPAIAATKMILNNGRCIITISEDDLVK